MEKSLNKILNGYKIFREKYALSDQSVMTTLANDGQKPKIMVVACCDSRVDPAVIMQCDPGELFVVRNVANIVPPYEKDDAHHGTSAALEFAICILEVKHLILLGHTQCGGIKALMQKDNNKDDFITNWVSVIDHSHSHQTVDECAKSALQESYKNCLEFPWIAKKVAEGALAVHLWFFDIKTGQIYCYNHESNNYDLL